MRRWSCGFELGSAVSGVECSTTFGNVSVGRVVDGFVVRKDNSGYGGDYSGRVQPTSGAFSFFSQAFAYRDENGPFWARSCMYINALPSVETSILAFTSRNGGQFMAWVSMDQTGAMRIYDTSGLLLFIADPGPIQRWAGLQLAFWRLPDLAVNVIGFQGIGDTGESEGPQLTFTRPLSTNGVYAFTCGGNLALEASSGFDMYVDDMAINDAVVDPSDPTGRAQTSWPGNGHIVHLAIDAAGDMTFAGTQGVDYETGPVTGQAPYLQMDETPTPDDAASELIFLHGSSAINQPPVIDFNISSTAKIPAHARISFLQIGARVASIR